MKKRLISALILIATFLFSSTSLAFTNTKIEPQKKQPVKPIKAVIVGYRESDREKIFGNKPEKEILKILHEECHNLLHSKNINSLNKSSRDGLFHSVILKDTKDSDVDSQNKLNNKLNKNEIIPFVYDEVPISASFVYTIGFNVDGVDMIGTYRTRVSGILSNLTKNAIIDGLDTSFIGYSPPQVNFYHRTYVDGTPTASIYFYQSSSLPGITALFEVKRFGYFEDPVFL